MTEVERERFAEIAARVLMASRPWYTRTRVDIHAMLMAQDQSAAQADAVIDHGLVCGWLVEKQVCGESVLRPGPRALSSRAEPQSRAG